MRRSCGGVNQRYGTMRLTTAFQKSVHDLFQIMQAHEDNEGVDAAYELTPLDLTAAVRCLVTGYDGNARCAGTVGDRDTGISWSGNRRTDARDDFIGIPARFKAAASSPPRPNTNGSPPLSRTTLCLRALCEREVLQFLFDWRSACRLACRRKSVRRFALHVPAVQRSPVDRKE